MESETMLTTPRGKSPLPKAKRRFKPAMLHHPGQRAQHTTDWAIPAPALTLVINQFSCSWYLTCTNGRYMYHTELLNTHTLLFTQTDSKYNCGQFKLVRSHPNKSIKKKLHKLKDGNKAWGNTWTHTISNSLFCCKSKSCTVYFMWQLKWQRQKQEKYKKNLKFNFRDIFMHRMALFSGQQLHDHVHTRNDGFCW